MQGNGASAGGGDGSGKRDTAVGGEGHAATFSVATFNLRGVSDRWREREPVLRHCLDKMDADIYAFQEVLTGAPPPLPVRRPPADLRSPPGPRPSTPPPPPLPCAGEYGQERRVLAPVYHVSPCRAALLNLSLAGGLMQWCAAGRGGAGRGGGGA